MKDAGTSISMAPSVTTMRPTRSTQKIQIKELQVYRKLERTSKSKAAIGTSMAPDFHDAALDCDIDAVEQQMETT